jgi:hypothetical protein
MSLAVDRSPGHHPLQDLSGMPVVKILFVDIVPALFGA